MHGNVLADDTASKDKFYQVWRKEFPYVLVRQPPSTSNKCHVCEDLQVGVRPGCVSAGTSYSLWTSPRSSFLLLRQILIGRTTSVMEIRALRLLQLEHLLPQQSERGQYYHHQHLATSQPHKYTSTTIDATAQDSCRIPRKTRYDYPGKRLTYKLIGAVVHRARG